MYNEGISKEGDLLDLAAKLNIVQKSGTWYSFGEDRLGQGRENVKNFIKENTEFRQKLEKLVRQKLGMLGEAESEEKPEKSTPEKSSKKAEKAN